MRRGRLMSKSVAPELRQYLRTKFAEPSGLDMYNQYAPDAPGMPTQTPPLAGMSRDEIAAAGTGQPKTIGEKYNPLTPEGRNAMFDGIANTDAVTNAGQYLKETWDYAQKNPLSRAMYNLPGIAAVATEAATNPTNSERPVAAAIEAVTNAGKAQQPAAAPTASIAAPAGEGGPQSSIFPLSDSTAYGLGGAGAGALLGAAMSRKGKRGRNALLGAGLGGGAGMLAQYLTQPGQQKTSMHTKSATGMLHDALGTGAGGAVIGGLYGALTAGKKKLLRSALRGALIGGGTGTALGAGVAAFGEPVGPTSDNPSAAEHSGFNRGFGSATSGALGAALSQRLADEYLPLENEEEKAGGLLYRDLKKPNAIAAETDFGYGLSAMKKQEPRFLTSFFSNTRNDVSRALDQTASDDTNDYDTHISELIGRQLVKNNPERYALPTHKDHLNEFVRLLGSEGEPKTKEDLQRMRTRYAPMQSPHYLDEKRRAEFNHIFKTMLSDKYLPKNKQAALDPSLIAPLTGAAVGGGIGALTDKKKRLRNALIGAAAGGGIGGAAEFALPGIGLGGKYRVQDFFRGHPAKPTNWANTLGRVPEIGEYSGRRESNLPGLQLLYGISAGEATRTPLDDLGDAAAPYTKRVGDGVKKVDEIATPWLDWFNGKKKQQP